MKVCKCGCGTILKEKKYIGNAKYTPKFAEGHYFNILKGKTYEEIYGKKLAQQKRQIHSKCMMGKDKGKTWSERYGIKEANKRRANMRRANRRRWLGKKYEDIYSPERVKEIKEKISKASKANWQKSEFRNKVVNKILSKISVHPNRFEFNCALKLNLLFPGKFIFCGDGSIVIGGKSPDFVSHELNVVILCNGLYWHLWRFGLKDTPENKRKVELKESMPFIKAGYEVWFIWEILNLKSFNDLQINSVGKVFEKEHIEC